MCVFLTTSQSHTLAYVSLLSLFVLITSHKNFVAFKKIRRETVYYSFDNNYLTHHDVQYNINKLRKDHFTSHCIIFKTSKSIFFFIRTFKLKTNSLIFTLKWWHSYFRKVIFYDFEIFHQRIACGMSFCNCFSLYLT